MADALEDEWWLQSANNETNDSDPAEDGDLAEKKEDEEDTSLKTGDKASKSKKRKLKDKKVVEKTDERIAEKTDGKIAEKTEESEEPPKKKKKKKKRKKMSDVVAKQSQETLTNDSIIQPLQKHFKGKLSPVEWDEMTLDGSKHFVDCNDMNHPPSAYLKMVIPKWKRILTKSESTPGSPLLIIVTSAALRVIELIRQIEEFKTPDARVMKLFAKHIKLNEQIEALEKRGIHIGVGTPNRLLALLDNGALKLSQLRYFVLDWTWRDQKLRRLVDIPEIRSDTFQLLTKYIIPQVKNNKAKLGLL